MACRRRNGLDDRSLRTERQPTKLHSLVAAQANDGGRRRSTNHGTQDEMVGRRKRRRSMTVSNTLFSTIHFPMSVITLEKLLEMTEMEPYQSLQERGEIIEYERGMGVVLFVSHQWRSRKNPDPGCEQLRVLQEALKNLRSGKVKVDIVLHNAIFGNPYANSEVDFSEIPKGRIFIWYDYFSIPQITDRRDSKDDLLPAHVGAAIDSIPAYVEMADYFVVLAPVVEHADDGTLMDYSTWRDRGWCRVERAARALSKGDTRMLLIRTPSQISIMSPVEVILTPVGTGRFTCDVDKVKLGPVMHNLVRNCLTRYLLSRDLPNYRLLVCMKSNLFRGLRGLPEDWCEVSRYGVPQFLDELGFTGPSERDERGWAPIHYAAIAGNVQVMRGLLKQRADVADCIDRAAPDLALPSGTPVLTLCAMARAQGSEPVHFLLSARADPNFLKKGAGLGREHQRIFSAIPALTAAARGDRADSILKLLSFRADVNRRAYGDHSAIWAASVWGATQAVSVLLQARANPDIDPEASIVSGPLHSAAMGVGQPDIAKLLLDARANINQKMLYPMWNPISFVFMCSSMQYQLGRKTALTRLAFHANGSTPLMLAVLAGNGRIARLLVERRADLTIRNNRGWDVLGLMQETQTPLRGLVLAAEESKKDSEPAASDAMPMAEKGKASHSDDKPLGSGLGA